MPKQEIVGFVGVIGSGKNYQKDLLLKEGYVGLDFKDELLRMASDLVGFDVTKDYEAFKKYVVGITEPANPKMISLEKESQNRKFLKMFPKAMTGRALLQRLGTEAMRKRDPNYWVNAWSKQAEVIIDAGRSIACADVRFQNEVDAIRKTAGYLRVNFRVIFCDYRSERYDATSTHPSEALARAYVETGVRDLTVLCHDDFVTHTRRKSLLQKLLGIEIISPREGA